MGFLKLRELDGVTAILGGSFDPIHNGHLHIARQILYWSRVAQVLFVPNGNHHFKKGLVRLSFSDRYNLVKSAIEGEERFAISTADRNGTGYTADLMRALYRDNPDTSYVFVIGSDNLPALPTWYNYPWLVKNAYFLVLPRPGFQIDMEVMHQIKASILPIELSPISSSDVRSRIDQGESITGLVPAELEPSIIRLYQATKAQDNNVKQA